jgi:hypothetical protein
MRYCCFFSERTGKKGVVEGIAEYIEAFVQSIFLLIMSSAPKELKRYGPTEGMLFTRQQADHLFQQYLNKKLMEV